MPNPAIRERRVNDNGIRFYDRGRRMRSMTATELARKLRVVLDSLERGEEELVVMRNRHPVARMVPGTARMTAIEALADLHQTLDDQTGEAWLADIEKSGNPDRDALRDPWA